MNHTTAYGNRTAPPHEPGAVFYYYIPASFDLRDGNVKRFLESFGTNFMSFIRKEPTSWIVSNVKYVFLVRTTEVLDIDQAYLDELKKGTKRGKYLTGKLGL